SLVNGTQIMGFATAGVDDHFVGHLATGDIYINIHTAMNAGGEIRGQLFRFLHEGYVMNLDGAQETTPVTNGARGIGFLSIDRNQSMAHYAIAVSGLSGAITAAHFHKAARGVDGGVEFDLSDKFAKTGNTDYAEGFLMLNDA